MPDEQEETPKRQPQVVFECRVGTFDKARVVAIPHRMSGGVERYETEILQHHAAMGEPVWKRVEDTGQLRAVIRCLIEKCPPYAEIEELRCAVNADGGIVKNVALVNDKVEALLKAIDEKYET